MKLDDQITTQDLLDLGREFKDFDPDTLQVYTPPATGADIGGASVLLLDKVGAQPMFDLFRGKADPNNPLRSILVEVRNGSGKVGQGQDVLKALDDVGFGTVASSDAASFRNQRTEIRYAPGAEPSVVQLARYLDGQPTFTVDRTLAANNLVLVTGRDFTALRTSPRPESDFASFLATTTTTTTAPGGAGGAPHHVTGDGARDAPGRDLRLSARRRGPKPRSWPPEGRPARVGRAPVGGRLRWVDFDAGWNPEGVQTTWPTSPSSGPATSVSRPVPASPTSGTT